MHVCVHAHMCRGWIKPSPPATNPPTPQGGTPEISEKSISLEQIVIFQFWLKNSDCDLTDFTKTLPTIVTTVRLIKFWLGHNKFWLRDKFWLGLIPTEQSEVIFGHQW